MCDISQETDVTFERKKNLAVCPECHTTLIPSSGCWYCPECGWSSCS